MFVSFIHTGGHSVKNRRNFPSHKHKCKTVRTLSYDLEKPQGFETVTLRIGNKSSNENYENLLCLKKTRKNQGGKLDIHVMSCT